MSSGKIFADIYPHNAHKQRQVVIKYYLYNHDMKTICKGLDVNRNFVATDWKTQICYISVNSKVNCTNEIKQNMILILIPFLPINLWIKDVKAHPLKFLY